MKQITKLSFVTIATAFLGACGNSDKESDVTELTVPDAQAQSAWYQDAQQNVELASERTVNHQPGAAKNVILFVGDGMGISTITAARILEGQMQGGSGEEHRLSFEKLPFSGLVKTYNTNQQTPDSAGTMTALMTGVKSKAGVLSVSEDVVRADCASSQGKELTTLAELAENSGKSTGIVTTARITHATPGAVYAKTPERNWEYSAPSGCKDIAAQLVEFAAGDGIDVAMGGGRRNFLPNNVTDIEGSSGKRTDGRNLVDEWKAKYPQGLYVQTQAEFDALSAGTSKVLGLFNSSHMQYEADRQNDIAGEPSLHEMTGKAIDLLSSNANGYFLMVEAGRIDHGHHAGSAYSALTDAVELSKAVKEAMEKTDPENTLIMVTADHSHVFTIAGYPTRGNPILGKVIGNDSSGQAESEPTLAGDDLPYTTVGYANGLGFADIGAETDADARYGSPADAGRKDLSNIDTTQAGFHQEALVPLGSETHAAEDVAVFARGPGADLVTGTIEQNVLFHVMAHSAGLLP